MRILCVDIGTGTQDIFLYDSRLHIENGFKLVVPSPTMIVRRRIQAATHAGRALLLVGDTMGGGPSMWAAQDHLQAGLPLYATPAAARSFNDDLDVIREMGVTVVEEEEAAGLSPQVERVTLRDFDFQAIARALAAFGVSLDDLDALAVAVFDHGAAPPHISDRQFRFDFIAGRLAQDNRLSAFAFPSEDIPPILTRMQAVARAAAVVDAPLLLMDTAPAAILGASLDPAAQTRPESLFTNIGNLHTLAFRLNRGRIEGVFEHHTGMLDRSKLEGLLRALAAGTLRHEQVFDDNGHGAHLMTAAPLRISDSGAGVVVTGPRRQMLHDSVLRPYFATPFGDMMLAGCYGLLAAAAELWPELAEPIRDSLQNGVGRPPWEV